MTDKLTRIKSIGFTPAGEWKKTDRGIEFDPNPKQMTTASNVLYAFVMEGELVYVGKTTITLRNRMQRYKTPAKNSKKGGTTNIKNHNKIKETLASGKSLHVYVLPDNGLLKYGGFHINLAAGLEDSLVRDLKPSWNGGRKESAQESLEQTQDESYSPTK